MKRSQKFDLGLDRTRIKDARDAQRQSATVDALLERLFHQDPNHRWEVQILADEVGMGKTFVALATAFSVLEAMQSGQAADDLRGCYQKILIITPTNSALFSKWVKEVGEFVKRCVKSEFRQQAGRWFSAARVERVDELASELRRPGSSARIVVASTSIFGAGKLRHYDAKRRHLLSTLFRHWGTRFKNDDREKLLKGAPAGWPTRPEHLKEFSDAETELLMFSSDELLPAIRDLDESERCIEMLLESCREIAAPYVRGRDEQFRKVEIQLVDVYRALMGNLINKSVPLVIVDEAHNWKNGPASGANGYRGFIDLIGRRSRRALLLTATPFQLRPAEMLEILKVGDDLRPCATEVESAVRRQRLAQHREAVVRPILENAARSSRRFTKAWSKLPAGVTSDAISSAWSGAAVTEARSRLWDAASNCGIVPAEILERHIDAALSDVEPDIRQLLREGLRLFVYNADVSHELGAVVIRHRRNAGHRHFRVGSEYQSANGGAKHRSDRHVLHAAPGVDVRGDGELPHYLLMRCVSEMKGGKGRSTGSALTGCYSTLIDSADGRAVQKRLGETDVGQMYLGLLMKMVNARHDPRHPKVREVVDSALNNWRSGEKTLIFCFRTNTAERLHEIIDARIRKELNHRRDLCMGGTEKLKTLRTRMTGRDRDLIVLGLDRVLWSLLWTPQLRTNSERPIIPDDLRLLDQELPQLAELGLRYRVDLLLERIDRVFLHRASECLMARRLLRDVKPSQELRTILSRVAEEEWVSGPYGLLPREEEEDSGAEAAHFDERGVHTHYAASGVADTAEVGRIANELQERRARARRQGQISILDVYERGPNLWLGSDPREVWNGRDGNSGPARTVRDLHGHILELMRGDGEFDWESRRTGYQAIRRAVLRESVLLRLLPDQEDSGEASWGELLAMRFFDPLPEQRESMADRIAVFLEDLMAASGTLTDPASARFALYDATRLRDQQFVALVSGTTDPHTRERVFSGFNTPLLPEVLICTSVGQEGIDLHRHCRHVVHFDLAWNPAVLEQRTGRADRIGSKTFRERAFVSEQVDSFLEIGVPYLAGTYDERMYEELRLRAQTFEVLTGGDLTADEAEGFDDHKKAEGTEAGLRFVPLPDSMVNAMRVSLHVWSEDATGAATIPPTSGHSNGEIAECETEQRA